MNKANKNQSDQKRDYVNEILSKKNRIAPATGRWELVSERINNLCLIPSVIDLVKDLENSSDLEKLENYSTIERAYKEVTYAGNVTREIARYIPIGLVACLEGYFRMVYADLINHGSPYKENASKFNERIKFSIEIAISLEKHSLSIRDFVAHLLTTNNINDINKNISDLIDDDFLKKLKSSRKLAIPHPGKILFDGDNKPYLAEPDYDELNNHMMESITRMFQLRHVFCHEINPGFDDFDAILRHPEAVIDFLFISEFVVDQLLKS